MRPRSSTTSTAGRLPISSSAAFTNVARTIGATWLTPAIHGVVRWRRRDLAQWIWEAFGISLDATTVGRELKRLGFAKGKGAGLVMPWCDTHAMEAHLAEISLAASILALMR